MQLCRRYALVTSLSLALGLLIFGRQLMSLYTNDAGVLAAGTALLWIVAMLQPLQSSQQVLAGALRGAGDTKAVAICIFIGIVVIRPVFSFALVNWAGLGLIGIWLALLCDQGSRSMYTMFRFISDKWSAIKV